MGCLVLRSRAWSPESNKNTGTYACGHIMICLVLRNRAWSSESNKNTGTYACGRIMICLVLRNRNTLFSKQKMLVFDWSVRRSLT
jgi:hypothetical protein